MVYNLRTLLNPWKRKFVNLRVSLESTEEFFWLNWYIYFRTVSYMRTQINLRLTIEITIVYHVNGCRWLKRQCYKFAYWIRHWHIPNVTVTKKIDNAIITVCSNEFSSLESREFVIRSEPTKCIIGTNITADSDVGNIIMLVTLWWWLI